MKLDSMERDALSNCKNERNVPDAVYAHRTKSASRARTPGDTGHVHYVNKPQKTLGLVRRIVNYRKSCNLRPRGVESLSVVSSSAERTLLVLELFAVDLHPLSPTQVAERLNINRSAAYRSIETLLANGYINRAGKGKFVLSVKLDAMTGQKRTTLHNPNKVQSILDRLSVRTGLHSAAAVLDGAQVTLLAQSSSTPQCPETHVGMRMDAHCTAVGRAILAANPKAKTVDMINQGLTTKTAFTITNHFDYLQEIENTKDRGYGIDNLEYSIDLRCVGIDVSIQLSQPMLGICLCGKSSNFDEKIIPDVGRILLEEKNQLSA